MRLVLLKKNWKQKPTDSDPVSSNMVASGSTNTNRKFPRAKASDGPFKKMARTRRTSIFFVFWSKTSKFQPETKFPAFFFTLTMEDVLQHQNPF